MWPPPCDQAIPLEGNWLEATLDISRQQRLSLPEMMMMMKMMMRRRRRLNKAVESWAVVSLEGIEMCEIVSHINCP